MTPSNAYQEYAKSVCEWCREPGYLLSLDGRRHCTGYDDDGDPMFDAPCTAKPLAEWTDEIAGELAALKEQARLIRERCIKAGFPEDEHWTPLGWLDLAIQQLAECAWDRGMAKELRVVAQCALDIEVQKHEQTRAERDQLRGHLEAETARVKVLLKALNRAEEYLKEVNDLDYPMDAIRAAIGAGAEDGATGWCIEDKEGRR